MNKKNILTQEDKLIADRLKTIWNEKKRELGLSQEVAAGKMGFNTQAAVSQFLNGKIPLNTENVLKFSEMLRVPPETIDPSIATLLKHVRTAEKEKTSPNIIEVKRYPLYEADHFLHVKKTGISVEPDIYVSTANHASKESFWLMVSGHSMTAPQGVKPSFPEGVMILIDPDEKVSLGDFCVAALSDFKDLTFKRYDRDAGDEYLVPLNPAYRTIKCDNSTKIIGKVVHAMWPDSVFSSRD